MKKISIKAICLAFFILLAGIPLYPQTDAFKIRIYDNSFDPHEHPDFRRKHVKPPNWELFDNKTQFITLRNLEGDFRKKLDDYTIKYDLGKVIWPSYTTLYLDNIDSIVYEIKKRNLFLFDLWGYVPGSGPGGYWQQFYPPKDVLDLFERELGDHWLGMDNGEQDGRYIGGFAKQQYPTGLDRKSQYFNFQNHFEALCDALGNKMATLVSLNFGHYFLKEGVYTFIGAETAQGLPNAQVYYSFIRGASKQYGVPWFGNSSVWNRWGYKSYQVDERYNGGPTKGTSLSLLKRLLYSQIFYNSMMVGFESGFLNGDALGSIGSIQQQANKWLREFGQPGNMMIQVALMVDFFSGWSFPRHLYSSEIYKVWGNLPYEPGDYLTNNILDMFYPGYQNSSYFHDETGFNVPTPYGDVVDCIFSDCPLWLMERYPVIVIAGALNQSIELKDKLEAYVEAGGCLVLTASNLPDRGSEWMGIKPKGHQVQLDPDSEIMIYGRAMKEDLPFTISPLEFPENAEILARWQDMPLAAAMNIGKGKLIVFSSNMGISDKAINLPVTSEIDVDLKNPYPLLNHIKNILHEVFEGQKLFNVGKELSYIINRESSGKYNLLVCNNGWEEKPLKIESQAGKIISLKENQLDEKEMHETGYFPDGFEDLKPGKNSNKSIAGGSVRIFTVEIDEENIETIPHYKHEKNNQGRYLRIKNEEMIKHAILSCPTFFQHFDGIVVDWTYLNERSVEAVKKEAGWINRQKLEIIVDFTSGLNLFPDLRLVNNDSIAYNKSIRSIKKVMEKMEILGSEHMILSPHRFVENNFTREQYISSFSSSLGEIGNLAETKGINVHLRLSIHKSLSLPIVQKMINNYEGGNVYVAPSLPYLSTGSGLDEFIKNDISLKTSMIFLSATKKDTFGQLISENAALAKLTDSAELEKILDNYSSVKWIFEGNYNSWDDAYLDIKYFNQISSLK
jgi:hypothetical protein